MTTATPLLPTIEVLICTCNEGINSIHERLPEPCANVQYLVSHQIFGNNTEYQSDALEQRLDVTVVKTNSKGLSNNRNNALLHASGDYLLITDDDIVLDADFAQTLQAGFAQFTDADVITFQIRTPEGQPFKVYYPGGKTHTRKSIFRVASVEIAIKHQSLQNSDVSFDTQFGLNAPFPSCEETVFLSDLMKAGLTLKTSDAVIAIHPAESSGSNYNTEASCRVRGAVIKRVFGWQGLPLVFVYALKHHAEYKQHRSLFAFLRLALNGYASA